MRVAVTDEQIQAAFEVVKDDPAFAENVSAMKEGRRPGEMLQALALRPDLLRAFTAISAAHYPGGIVERGLKELIILEASRRNACQYCTSTHTLIARMMGMSDDPISLLDQPDRQTERQSLALEYTRGHGRLLGKPRARRTFRAVEKAIHRRGDRRDHLRPRLHQLPESVQQLFARDVSR